MSELSSVLAGAAVEDSEISLSDESREVIAKAALGAIETLTDNVEDLERLRGVLRVMHRAAVTGTLKADPAELYKLIGMAGRGALSDVGVRESEIERDLQAIRKQESGAEAEDESRDAG